MMMMMKSLLSCIFLLLMFAGGVEASKNTKATGNAKAPDQIDNKRHDSKPSDGLHHVLITYSGTEIGVCGGSLISQEWILTAGICNISDTEVILGHHPNLKGQRRKIIDKIYYTDGKITHNIMLIKVEKKDKFPIIVLPDVNKCKVPVNNEAVDFFAWMNAYDFNKNKDVPQKLQTGQPTVTACTSLPEIDKQPVPDYLEKDQNLLCTKNIADQDCELFAGSSLVLNNVLHGVLVNYDLDCKKQIEFKDICKYRRWIKNITGV